MPDSDYTELLDRIDGHLRALHVAGHELFILADLKDDIVTLTDHVLDARLDAEGWEREARRLRERWCMLVGGHWCALPGRHEPVAPRGTNVRTVCNRYPWVGLNDTPTFEHREPSCPDCREVLCLDPK